MIEIDGGLVADTPGFSSLEFHELEAEDLGDCFPEMARLSHQCKFRGCLHMEEPQCAVKEAVRATKSLHTGMNIINCLCRKLKTESRGIDYGKNCTIHFVCRFFQAG